MSNIWKEIKDNIKVWGTAAIEKAEEVSKLAVEKTGDFTKISKIKLDIYQTQKDIGNIFEDLGHLVYLQVTKKNTFSFKTNSDFNDTIKKINDFKLKIQRYEKEIDKIKKEIEKAATIVKPKKQTSKKPQAPKKKTVKTATKK